MSEQDRVRAKIRSYVDQAYPALDQIDYYRMLGISSAASEQEVRTAYYRLAARLHPDVHGDGLEPEYRVRLTAVFSRVVEAYKVLSDAGRRSEYDSVLGGGAMRLQGRRNTSRPKSPEECISDASARRFYKLAQDALADRNLSSAAMNCQFALSMEPDNAVIKALLAEIEGKK